LESEETLGGTWCASRIFPELLTQQSREQYAYTDTPFEPSDDPPQPGDYIPSRRVHEYLNMYAERWGIKDKIRFGVTVERCKRAPDSIKWEVHLQGQTQESPLVCDKLVIATGLTSTPNLPDIPTENFTPPMFHSRYFGQHYSTLQSKDINTVCVYGGGKSGYDAVAAAVNNGKRAHWIIRNSKGGGMPAIYKPMLLGQPTGDKPFTPASNWTAPDITNTTSWSYRFLHSGKSWLGAWILWWYMGLMTRLVLGGWKFDENENLKKLKPEVWDRKCVSSLLYPNSILYLTIIQHLLVYPGAVFGAGRKNYQPYPRGQGHYDSQGGNHKTIRKSNSPFQWYHSQHGYARACHRMENDLPNI
jgi:dimethylaniline monooxygenase (N-oxide forming)